MSVEPIFHPGLWATLNLDGNFVASRRKFLVFLIKDKGAPAVVPAE